ncbi:hypothetical protein DAPPUDRAFT_99476 [Daphnia pulex]|uniref:Uncharacterized protein n=1 Tax=Daphnia pulex TaxID=6669 RepID=E9G701_DAPPU|nr:hypothetical protein DAPPUDRAFT_99476 [Daphnia pulex]|eukprot:EFX84723.1 hypothetical protein DAPPUDRAFT_99476 [Daphnia pulex]
MARWIQYVRMESALVSMTLSIHGSICKRFRESRHKLGLKAAFEATFWYLKEFCFGRRSAEIHPTTWSLAIPHVPPKLSKMDTKSSPVRFEATIQWSWPLWIICIQVSEVAAGKSKSHPSVVSYNPPILGNCFLINIMAALIWEDSSHCPATVKLSISAFDRFIFRCPLCDPRV